MGRNPKIYAALLTFQQYFQRHKQKKSQKGSSQAIARFERLKNRNKKRNVEKKLQEDGHHILSNDIESNTEISELSMEEESSLDMTKDFGCQVIIFIHFQSM